MNQPINALASCLTRDGACTVVYGLIDQKPAYAILRNGAGGAVLESGACQGVDLPVARVNGLDFASFGAELHLMARGKAGELLMFRSVDGGKSYAQAGLLVDLKPSK